MRARGPFLLLALLSCSGLAGCDDPSPAPILGTLEWDRVAVTAELAEPVLKWDVAEGDRVAVRPPADVGGER